MTVTLSGKLPNKYFTQHVKKCTRNDLVIEDEPDMVHDFVNVGHFPSDNNTLDWVYKENDYMLLFLSTFVYHERLLAYILRSASDRKAIIIIKLMQR